MNLTDMTATQVKTAITALLRYNSSKHPEHVNQQISVFLGLPFEYDTLVKDRELRQQVNILQALIRNRKPTDKAVNHFIWLYRRAIKDGTPAFDAVTGKLTYAGACEYLGVPYGSKFYIYADDFSVSNDQLFDLFDMLKFDVGVL